MFVVKQQGKKAIKKRNKKWKLYNATKKDIDCRKYKEC